MSYSRPHPGVLRRNIILTLTLALAFGIISSVLWIQASDLGLDHSSLLLQSLEVVLFSLTFLFTAVLLGSIAEVLRRTPGPITLAFAFILPLLLAWVIGIFEYRILTYAIVAGMGVVTFYLYASTPKGSS